MSAEQKEQKIEITNENESLKIYIGNNFYIEYTSFVICKKYFKTYSFQDLVFRNIPVQYLYNVFQTLINTNSYSIEEYSQNIIRIRFNYTYYNIELPIYFLLDLKLMNDVDLQLIQINNLNTKIKKLESKLESYVNSSNVPTPVELKIEGVYNLAHWVKDYKAEILDLEVVEYKRSENKTDVQDSTILFKIKANIMSCKQDRIKIVQKCNLSHNNYSSYEPITGTKITPNILYNTNKYYFIIDKVDMANYINSSYISLFEKDIKKYESLVY
jgi:hypothetical protein